MAQYWLRKSAVNSVAKANKSTKSRTVRRRGRRRSKSVFRAYYDPPLLNIKRRQIAHLLAEEATGVTVDAGNADTIADTLAPTTVLGSITLTGGNADTIADTLAPTTVLGSITLTGGNADTIADTLAPTTVLGSITLTGGNADTIVDTADPALVFGSMTVDVGNADTIVDTFDPTIPIVAGNADLIVDTIAPTLIFGSLTADGGNADIVGDTIDPSVVLASMTLTPGPADTVTDSAGPTTILGNLTLTPAGADSVFDTADPVTILGSITITANADTIVDTADPEVSISAITPDPVDAIVDTSGPTVILGNLTLTPAGADSILDCVVGAVVLDSMTVTTTAADIIVDTVDPFTIQQSLTLTPGNADIVCDTVAPSVILGSATVTPELAEVIVDAVNPIVIVPPQPPEEEETLMGIFSDLITQSLTFKTGDPLWNFLNGELVSYEPVDPAVPAAAAAANSVQSIAQDATDHTGGTFKLVIPLRSGETISTAAIAFNANAATIETAIDAAADGQDEVQTIAQDGTDYTGGTFALTINLRTTNGIESFTTAGIAYNANAATIEGAIDTAATAAAITGWVNGAISVSGGILQAAGAPVVLTFDGAAVDDMPHGLTVFDPALLTGGAEPTTRVTRTTPGSTVIAGWTAADISVSGGILQAAGAPVVLTFDGTSVAGQAHPIASFDASLLTGGTEPATRVTITTRGQSQRNAWAALLALDIITGTLPDQDADADVSLVTKGSNSLGVTGNIINALAKEAAFEDQNNATYFTIMGGLGFDVRAPQVEPTGNDTELA